MFVCHFVDPDLGVVKEEPTEFEGFEGWGTFCTLVLRFQGNFKNFFLTQRHKGIVFKCIFMSWLFDSLDLSSERKDTHWLMSRIDYGFNQWSVVSFAIKKLYLYLFMVDRCIYLVILMYFMQIYFHLLWSGNEFTDFALFLNFLLTLHATWVIKKTKILRRLLLAVIFCTLTLWSHVRKP